MSHGARDWLDQAIDRNRVALLRVVAVLFGMVGLEVGGADTVPRRVWRRVLRLLRPAESALRRLIVIAARDISVELRPRRAGKAPSAIDRLQTAGHLVARTGVDLGLARAPQPQPPVAAPDAGPRLPAFRLVDQPRRFDTAAWDGKRPFPKDGFPPDAPDEQVEAAFLCRRILALKAALDDLDGQAKRLARWRARRKAAYPHARLSPLRLGHPPGRRKRPDHAVDELLTDLHALARYAVSRPDTS